MGYVDRNLLPGETVTYRTTLHPIIFATPIFFALVGILLLALGSLDRAVRGVAVAGVVFLLVAAVVGLARFIRFKTSEFAITDRRVLVKIGFIQRHTLELLLSKVEAIGVDQGLLGRLFNYGTIVVTGTGGTKEPFPGIANPLEFRRQVQARATER